MVRDTPLISAVLNATNLTFDVDVNVLLGLYILASNDTFWQPYFDIFPKRLSIPSYWTPEEELVLNGTETMTRENGWRARVWFAYAQLRNAGLTDATNVLANVTFEDLFWAASIVHTRGYLMRLPPNNDVEICLIPIADLAVHARPPHANVRTMFMVDTNSTCEQAVKHGIDPGEEVRHDIPRRWHLSESYPTAGYPTATGMVPHGVILARRSFVPSHCPSVGRAPSFPSWSVVAEWALGGGRVGGWVGGWAGGWVGGVCARFWRVPCGTETGDPTEHRA